MSKLKCCVLPESLKQNNRRLNMSFSEFPQAQCQFFGVSTDTYEYNGNYYCLLHLPCESKDKIKLANQIQEKIQDFIAKNEINFNYICVDKINITKTISNLEYSFVGIFARELIFSNCEFRSLKLERSKIKEKIIFNHCTTEKLTLSGCQLNGGMSINNPKFNFMLILGNSFGLAKNILYDDVENLFLIRKGNIETARFIGNNVYTIFEITQTSFKQLRFMKNKFSSCPILFKEDCNKISEIDLPMKNEYSFTVAKMKYAKKRIWHDEYIKFREIYNIAKMREMYIEQSTYFSLMQRCQRNSSSSSCVFKFCSICYWLISDYGQSLARPMVCLFMLFLTCAFLFFSFGITKTNATYLSLMQILKPYSLLYDREPRLLLNSFCIDDQTNKKIERTSCELPITQYKYGGFFVLISMLESTLSLAFLASLILALRWNFRKA